MRFKKLFIAFALCLITFVVSAENQQESPELAGTEHEFVLPSSQSVSFQAIVEMAEQGYAEAQNNLGAMYYSGYGVTKNDIEAAKWFRKAAEQGHVGAYGNLGWLLITQGKFDDAQNIIEKAHQKQPQVFSWSMNLGHIYLLKGDPQTARSYYQEALPLIPDEARFEQGPIADFELFIENGWQVKVCRSELEWIRSAFEQLKLATTYDDQMFQYYQQGLLKEALFLAEKAFHIRKYILGEKHLDTISSLNILALIYQGLGRNFEALPLFEKVYHLRKDVLGEKHLSTLTSLVTVAGIYLHLGRILESLPWFEKSYNLSKEVLGEKHSSTLTSLNVLALIYRSSGRFSEALPLSKKSYHLRKEMLGEKHPDTISSVTSLATIYQKLGRLSDAWFWSEKGYRLSKEVVGEEHLDTIINMNNLAGIYQDLGMLKKALPLSEKSYHLFKDVLGEQHQSTLTSLNNLAIIYRDLGSISEALPLSEKAYRLRKEVLGEKHPDTLTSMNNFAGIYQDLGRFSDALPWFEKAYRLRKETLGEQHPDTLTSLGNLAGIYRDLGRFSEALPLFQEAYRLKKEVLGEKHPDTLISMINLAGIYLYLGDLSAGLPWFEKSYSLSKDVLGEKHPKTLTSMNNLALIYQDLGRLSEALSLYEKGYNLSKEVLGEKHPETLISLINLASIYRNLGRLSDALPWFEKAYHLSKNVLGEKHPDTLTSMIHLASIYQDLGLFSDALPLYEKGYRLSTETLGEKHPDILSSLNNLAGIYQDLGRSSEAMPLLEKAYRLSSEVLGEKHPSTISSMHNLAVIYQNLNRISDALPLLEKSYRLSKEVLGEKHPDTLISMTGWAVVIYKNSDRLSEALPLLEKAYRLRKEVLGEQHPDTHDSLHNLANLYEKQGNIEEAINHLEKFVKGVETLRSADLSAENRQALFKKRVPDYFLLSNLYLAQSRPVDAFRLGEMSKARTLLESLAAKLAAQQSGLTKAEQQQLQDYDARIAFLNNRIGKARQDNRLEEKLVLEAEKNQLVIQFAQFERELRAKYPKYAQLREVQIISAKDGAKHLPADAVLISYIVNENEVLAFTLQYDGTLTTHNLGEIPNLEKNLETYRQLLLKGIQEQNESAPSFHENKPFRLKKRPTIQSLSRQLGKQLLEPLKDIIKDKPHWIISPSGALASIPFETMHLDEQPVIAQHQITYVQSLSVFTLLQKRDKVYNNLKNRGTLLAMGAPLYQNTGTSKGNPSTTDYNIARQIVNRSGDYARALEQLDFTWQNLPGALAELEQLEKLFKETKPRIYIKAESTEAKLQNINQQGVLAQYRYLVFSAHGYLSPQVPALSSIVLGQINNPPGIDGYVTAGEWAGYDLKSDLMVLSACETGVGKVVGGEGIMGLPYAFYVAGNKNTILTLWKIADNITTEFITSFFAKLKAGVGQIEALTATKREFLKKGGIYSNPKYWAAFVLYGV